MTIQRRINPAPSAFAAIPNRTVATLGAISARLVFDGAMALATAPFDSPIAPQGTGRRACRSFLPNRSRRDRLWRLPRSVLHDRDSTLDRVGLLLGLACADGHRGDRNMMAPMQPDPRPTRKPLPVPTKGHPLLRPHFSGEGVADKPELQGRNVSSNWSPRFEKVTVFTPSDNFHDPLSFSIESFPVSFHQELNRDLTPS